MARAGLVAKKVAVRVKGKTIMRTMWVRANPKKVGLRSSGMMIRKGSVLDKLRQHKGKLIGAAMLAATAYGLHKGGRALAAAPGGARMGHAIFKAHAAEAGVKTTMRQRLGVALQGATAAMRAHHGDSAVGTRVAGAFRSAGHEVAQTARFGAGLAKIAGTSLRHPIEAVKAFGSVVKAGATHIRGLRPPPRAAKV